ncbi:glycogen debranching enzyme, putative [Chitinophaga sp. CF118]|uniref:amylo-alpha-1,6-glucosidase n=1 Tax=Chitinophaga sp. CF118 TaxID=1884367 RepID=UPI0008E3DE28|nr:amylo-alpha-1,6-glucosidase [Chitinophaga sp. CF118]SFE44765.1 glycogen debranching enzyme, putative [Chitinophaga sp. CF118]
MMQIDNMLMRDLAYTTVREYLVVAAAGAYTAGTISGCNTRKYHGLFVAPQPQLDDNDHVLLSALDETILYDNNVYPLAVRQYPGVYYPDGHALMAGFTGSPLPRWTFKAGNAVIVKELLMDDEENRIYIRYTLAEGPAAVTLQLQPFLAFRNMHTLGKANYQANLAVGKVPGGIQTKLYNQYDDLFLQITGDVVFSNNGYWYYNVAYTVEQERGYASYEDLYSPGHFEVTLAKEQPVIFTAGFTIREPEENAPTFKRLLAARPVPQTMKEHLFNAAKQFIINTDDGIMVRAGYYWFGSWGRDTCIALPGLTLLTGNITAFTNVINTMQAGLKNGLLANAGSGEYAIYNTVDASLWFVWSLQYFADHYSNRAKVWAMYKDALGSILYHYREGTLYGIGMQENGLISAGEEGFALTWMDAVEGGVPVTPRRGMPVEINALWYNAVCFCLEAARSARDETFVDEWEQYPVKIATAFTDLFWDENRQYLADCIQEEENDWSVRPNQLFAVSLPFTPLTPGMQKAVMEKIKNELLTPRGLRTLSPLDDRYRGHYSGSQLTRDHAYHQGTVWPWLLAHFAEGCLRTDGAAALPLLEGLYKGMAATLEEICLYSVPEVFEGNHPYKAGGAVAQAWSVAELIRMEDIISAFEAKALMVNTV